MTDCLAPRHGDADEIPEAEPHAVLCRPCRLGLARDLRRLPALHAELGHLLAASQGATHGRGGGEGLPFNDSASECRSQIRHDLTVWTMEVTKERGLDAPPPTMDDSWSANPVAAMCGWLHPQVTWCSFRPWAGDMAGALGEDAGRARAVLDPWVTVRFEIPGADGVCFCGQGRMVATIYASDGDRRRPALDCPVCGEHVEPESWLGYGKRVIARRAAVAG